MQATILRRGGLVVDTVPDPVPGLGQALIRTRACGVCGTDLHMISDGPHMMEQFRKAGVARPIDFGADIVLGHEFCGEVVDYGPGTQAAIRRGALVACLPTGIGLSNTRTGGLGELVAVDVDKLLPVTNGLAAECAALAEPMAVGLHAVAKSQLREADHPLVIGCGPVGLAVIAALRSCGVKSITAADFSFARRQLALTMGAGHVVDPAQASPYLAWPGSIVFECAGRPGVLQSIVEGVPRQARIVMVGACAKTDRFEPMVGTLKEVNIQFAVAYTALEFEQTLRNLCEGAIDVAPMITQKVGRDGVAAAMRALANPESQVKVVVEPWR